MKHAVYLSYCDRKYERTSVKRIVVYMACFLQKNKCIGLDTTEAYVVNLLLSDTNAPRIDCDTYLRMVFVYLRDAFENDRF